MEPIDLSDNSNFSEGFPHHFFSFLRTFREPYWHPPTNKTPDHEGFWVISRYHDAVHVLTNPKIFSSDRGGQRKKGGTAIKDEITAGKVLNQTDDPQHRRLRALVNKGFTAKAVGKLKEELNIIAREITFNIDRNTTFDFVKKISEIIPTRAICLVLGIPENDVPRLTNWVNKGIEVQSDSVIATEYANKIRKYGQELILKKREKPTDDIFSSIVHAEFEEDGSTLSDYELRSFFSLLFPAGVETTTRSISGGMLALIENPCQWKKLMMLGQTGKKSVEEIVRWTTPSCYKRRTAVRDTEIAGVKICAGDKVTVWEMSANRDASVFPDPFVFNTERTPNKHLGFGIGRHFCLGASLARLELRIIFNALIERGINLKIAEAPTYVANNRLTGLKHLFVTATN